MLLPVAARRGTLSIFGFVRRASKSTTEQPFSYAGRQSKKITVTVFAERAKTRTGKGLAPVIFFRKAILLHLPKQFLKGMQ
ncbi:hypothetical protein [Flavobacterium tegetincola]|uniref:hypothetical protein n=1 Tax=Flavobacterium tegetincola TaxID=150172 RepID=UPI00047C9C44|nr:hypothetical protein [Flavobacterium tegetincola]